MSCYAKNIKQRSISLCQSLALGLVLWGKGQEFGEHSQWPSAAAMFAPQVFLSKLLGVHISPLCPLSPLVWSVPLGPYCEVRVWTPSPRSSGDRGSDGRRCWFCEVGFRHRISKLSIDGIVMCWRNLTIFSYIFTPWYLQHLVTWTCGFWFCKRALECCWNSRVREFLDVRIWLFVLEASARLQQALDSHVDL